MARRLDPPGLKALGLSPSDIGKWDAAASGGGGGGSGDVTGPSSSTDGHLAVFDGTDGKKIKDGGTPGSGGSYLSTNVARVDPSGDDSTGTVGDLTKPFLTVQAAINQAIANALSFIAINIGANQFGEDLTIDTAINVQFIGVGKFMSTGGSVAFNSLTLSVAAEIQSLNCSLSDVTTSENLTLRLENSTVGQVTSTKSGIGSFLNVISLSADSESNGIDGTNVATLTVQGLRPFGLGTDTITCGATIKIRNCGQQSGYTGCYIVDASNGGGDITAENSTLDSLVAGYNSFTSIDSGVIQGVPSGGNAFTYQDTRQNLKFRDASTLPQGTSEPPGLNIGDTWIDTTAGTNIVKVKLS